MKPRKSIFKAGLASFVLAMTMSSAFADFVPGQASLTAGNYKKAMSEFGKGAREGDSESQYSLATMYEIGLGMPASLDEAYRWYAEAANNGHRDAQYILGWMYATSYYGETVIVKPDEKKADLWANMAARQGQVDAQRFLALARTVPEWLERVAAAGDRNAQFKLGYEYARGVNYAEDKALASKWIEKAAKNGHYVSQRDMAHANQYGDGVEKNREKALYWRKKLTDHGKSEDMVELIKLEIGDSITLESLAENGNALAQYALAYDYLRLEKNQLGIDWLKKSAQQGLAYAQQELALSYCSGRRVVKDDALCFDLSNKAAKQGLPEAQEKLGFLYAIGRGTKKNASEALYWYLIAAENGSAHGLNEVDKILEGGQFLVPALMKGDANAKYLLGFVYEHGLSTAQRSNLAAFWYGQAAKQGHARAKDRLAKLRSSTIN